MHSFVRVAVDATTPSGSRSPTMRNIEQCLAKAAEMEQSATEGHHSVQAEYRHMANCWRGLARHAAEAAEWTSPRAVQR
jgi:hypothetical protein